MTPSSRLPIRRVNRSGGVDELGFYEPASKSLDLAAPGFPLLGPGVHVHDGDLPWVFDEMAPSGFLARRFARWFPELRLREDRQLWRADEILQAISRRGHDLPGNLLVGDESFERYQRIFVDDRSPGPPPSSARREYPHFVRDILEEDCAKSSVGGERPKFSLRLSDGSGRAAIAAPRPSRRRRIRSPTAADGWLPSRPAGARLFAKGHVEAAPPRSPAQRRLHRRH